MTIARALSECGSHLLLVFSGSEIFKRVLSVSHSNDPVARAMTLQEVFSLTTLLLERSTFNNFVCSLLDATTTLAENTRYAIPEQLDILMEVVSGCHGDDLPVCVSTLQNIARLAKHSHAWKEDHLKKLNQLKSRVSSTESSYRRYLDVLVELTKKARPGLITGLDETLSEIGNLGQSDCMTLRVRYLEVSCNMLSRVPNQRKWQMLCGPFLSTTCEELPKNLAKKFYRTLGRFLCCAEVPPERVLSLLDNVLDKPVTHANITLLIDLCCQITNRLPFVVEKLHNWAKILVQKESNILSPSMAYLLLAPSIQLPTGLDTLAKGTDYDRYTVARVAFRNGHWKSAAFPNLQAININRLSLDNCEWIQSLTELAASQNQRILCERLIRTKQTPL
ncbi:hypothetical protein NECAME_13122 [Necator americanus]|uniref:Integrator complex subunit 7 N-terminal domain-containing protein n=1 Tax=Necator americanus TaxID=51031 RepID=W2SZ29_NECAM|nr:hypothetical protein NECAME_13122 [Necator americanus]ETN74216.1 hypothetical protein NECAME_13122 [Necator americanus]